jgi:hypothetical protein
MRDQVNAELFWAHEGAGAGALGGVTAVALRLLTVSTVYGGNLFYPAEAAREVYRYFTEWTRGLDEQMTSAVTLINFPPLPDVPEPLRGRSVVLVRAAYRGTDLRGGRELIDAWRQWRAPEIDMFGPMPFSPSDMISMDPAQPLPALLATEWFDDFHANAADVVVEATFPKPGRQPSILFAELRHAGGAMRRQAGAAANDRGRAGEMLLHLVAVPTIPDAIPALAAHLRCTREKLAPYVSGAVCLDFLDGEDRCARAQRAHSAANLAPLRRVKATIDPGNRFGFGFGIAE